MSAALYAEVAKEAGVYVATAKKILQALSMSTGRRPKAEGSLKKPNIGKLFVTTRKALPPRQKVLLGRAMQIERQPAKKRIKFVASKPLMDAAAE